MGDFSDDYDGYDFYDRMELDEQRDKERRAQRAKLLTPPKPQQEPMHPELRKMWEDYFDKCFRRKPLTDKQILADETLRYYFGQNGGAGPVSKQGRKVVNAIEALHEIKEVKSCGS
jgi:hypothetical protein